MPAEADDAPFKRGTESIRHPLTRTLLVLTFTTGLIDAVSFLALGHVFTANMTGNVVLLGFGIAGSGGLPVVGPIISLAAFGVGSAVGGFCLDRIGHRHTALMGWALGIEVALLAAAAVIGAVASVKPDQAVAYILISVMALAMGFRNAVIRHLAVPDLPTTVLTGTLSALAANLPRAGITNAGFVRRTAAVALMLAGAVAGALLLKRTIFAPLALAAVLAVVAAVTYLPWAARQGT